MKKGSPIIRPVEILVGVRDIAAFLKVRKGRVLELERQGAPIVRDENNIVRAEKAELWEWYKR